MRAVLTRITRMDRKELAWRARVATRDAAERAMFHLRQPRWDRRAIESILGDSPALEPVRQAAAAGRWQDANLALAHHIAARHGRFLIDPARKDELVAAIRAAFPGSVQDSAARGDRILAGAHDLLGYRGLRFDGWNHDPVHQRYAPLRFWSEVSYLDPACGDHKIIWERNRHQHTLALGRAFWLTGNPKYRDRFITDLAGWLEANPPLRGINWASMLELALRSLSWVWALHFFADDIERHETPWIVDLLVALDRQLTHVERHLSYYFSPNTHLLGEATALYVAGRVLPELRRSGRWQAVGRSILRDEIGRQVAADGGHCERSTHYHRYTLDYYQLALAVARITSDPIAADFERVVARLASAARLLSDNRGRAPHLGDDDGGLLAPFGGRAVDDWRDTLAIAGALTRRPDLAVGAVPEEAFWWLGPNAAQIADSADDGRAHRAGAPAPVPSAALPDTGYYISRSPRGDHLVIDAGPHGYQNGGHAHADALSLTTTVAGVPMLIDCGTGCYTIDPDVRDRLRSTALHNTLVVDGRSQSIPRGPFHWSHVATGSAGRWRTNEGFDYFAGQHDGYRPLVHRRHVLALHGDLLVVADLVSGDDAGAHSVAVHWHIDPRWKVKADGRGAVLTHGSDRVELIVPHGALESFTGDRASGLGWHAPVYGRLEPATTLRATHEGAAPIWMVSVFGLAWGNALRSVDIVPVWAEAGTLRHSIGLRIVREASIDHLLIAEPAADHAGAARRLAELETDAHMLFVRTAGDQRITRIAMVDGSHVRSASRRTLELSVPRAVPDLHLDLRDDARLAGSALGARVVVDGRERAVSPERRTAARAQSARSTN